MGTQVGQGWTPVLMKARQSHSLCGSRGLSHPRPCHRGNLVHRSPPQLSRCLVLIHFPFPHPGSGWGNVPWNRKSSRTCIPALDLADEILGHVVSVKRPQGRVQTGLGDVQPRQGMV